MKKLTVAAMTLVLTLSVLTGCGCRNSRPANTVPTTLPTVTTAPTTEMTTVPTTTPTEATESTIQDGNGPISTDTTTATDETDMNRSRGMTGSAGSSNGITGSITG